MPAIETQAYNTAEDFLDALGASARRWNGERHLWVFRGHADDRYVLVPSALRSRPKADLGYTYSPKKGPQATVQEQVEAEFEHLHEFFWTADAQGLSIPGEANVLRTPDEWEKIRQSINSHGWVPDQLLPLAALAQHYGVSTRLLDWTDRPLVAAYFAASGVSATPGTGELSVWGLNMDWVVYTGFPSSEVFSPLYVVTAPRFSNPNLHAQGGVFTTERVSDSLKSKTRLVVETVDEIVQRRWKRVKASGPVMTRYTLPWIYAGRLLRLLAFDGISAATVYPGYKGVVEALRERARWDMPQRATFWLSNP